MPTDADRAWQYVLANTRPVPATRRSLADALHHYLAAPAHTNRDSPEYCRAAAHGAIIVPASAKRVAAGAHVVSRTWGNCA